MSVHFLTEVDDNSKKTNTLNQGYKNFKNALNPDTTTSLGD
jgi:hypothetical protein